MKPRQSTHGIFLRAFAALLAPAALVSAILSASGAVSLKLGLAAAGAAVVLAAVLAQFAAKAEARRRAVQDDAQEAAAAAARELESLLAGDEAVFTALPDPLLMISAEGRIQRANPAAEELFEDSPGGGPGGPGLAGRDLSAIMRNPELLDAVDEVLSGAENRVTEFARGGAVARYFGARVARLSAQRRDGALAIVSLHDLTALKRAEQMRADFVANASHELRTPLASLLGFIETLQGPAREDPEAQRRFLNVMQDQGRRMARLIEDLLSLSRIELQEHTPPRGSVDLAGLVRSVAGTLQPQARAKSMSFVFDLDGLPPVIGDGDELAQVIQNLVDNAIKYGRADSPVRIGGRVLQSGSSAARRLGRPGVALSVNNQGEEIAREHLPRLTERFYRVDAARSRKLGGTGLGLAIVKHILNRHRGVLEVESAPGAGTTFTVLLPRAEGERRTPAA
jgi:two-component system phosphate regulon sensor histidine kinase PhoR